MIRKAEVSLRPEDWSDDQSFLIELFHSVAESELGFLHIEPAQRRKIVLEQLLIQRTHWAAAFPQCWKTIILVDHQPAGRFYVNQHASSMRVVELSLLPEYRQQGIGTQLIKQIQAEATRLSIPLRLKVLIGNEARNFYQRLGFSEIRRVEMHAELEWRA